jgi:hypothetical protein
LEDGEITRRVTLADWALQKTKKTNLGIEIHSVQRNFIQMTQLITWPFIFGPSGSYSMAEPVSKMASQQEKAFCVLRFEVSRSVITVLSEFRARRKKDIILVWCVLFKPGTKHTLHCNHSSGHLKTEYTESLPLLVSHLGKWSRGPAVSTRSELLVAHEKLGQFPLLTV